MFAIAALVRRALSAAPTTLVGCKVNRTEARTELDLDDTSAMFAEHGWVVIRGLLDSDEVAAVASA